MESQALPSLQNDNENYGLQDAVDQRRKRSSILKLTKSPARPVLQDLDVNQQEEDTKRRLSRRVSFADTYQIKEYLTDSVSLCFWNETQEKPVPHSDESASALSEGDPSMGSHLHGLESLLSGKIQTKDEDPVLRTDEVFASDPTSEFAAGDPNFKRKRKDSSYLCGQQPQTGDASTAVPVHAIVATAHREKKRRVLQPIDGHLSGTGGNDSTHCGRIHSHKLGDKTIWLGEDMDITYKDWTINKSCVEDINVEMNSLALNRTCHDQDAMEFTYIEQKTVHATLHEVEVSQCNNKTMLFSESGECDVSITCFEKSFVGPENFVVSENDSDRSVDDTDEKFDAHEVLKHFECNLINTLPDDSSPPTRLDLEVNKATSTQLHSVESNLSRGVDEGSGNLSTTNANPVSSPQNSITVDTLHSNAHVSDAMLEQKSSCLPFTMCTVQVISDADATTCSAEANLSSEAQLQPCSELMTNVSNSEGFQSVIVETNKVDIDSVEKMQLYSEDMEPTECINRNVVLLNGEDSDLSCNEEVANEDSPRNVSADMEETRCVTVDINFASRQQSTSLPGVNSRRQTIIFDAENADVDITGVVDVPIMLSLSKPFNNDKENVCTSGDVKELETFHKENEIEKRGEITRCPTVDINFLLKHPSASIASDHFRRQDAIFEGENVDLRDSAHIGAATIVSNSIKDKENRCDCEADQEVEMFQIENKIIEPVETTFSDLDAENISHNPSQPTNGSLTCEPTSVLLQEAELALHLVSEYKKGADNCFDPTATLPDSQETAVVGATQHLKTVADSEKVIVCQDLPLSICSGADAEMEYLHPSSNTTAVQPSQYTEEKVTTAQNGISLCAEKMFTDEALPSLSCAETDNINEDVSSLNPSLIGESVFMQQSRCVLEGILDALPSSGSDEGPVGMNGKIASVHSLPIPGDEAAHLPCTGKEILTAHDALTGLDMENMCVDNALVLPDSGESTIVGDQVVACHSSLPTETGASQFSQIVATEVVGSPVYTRPSEEIMDLECSSAADACTSQSGLNNPKIELCVPLKVCSEPVCSNLDGPESMLESKGLPALIENLPSRKRSLLRSMDECKCDDMMNGSNTFDNKRYKEQKLHEETVIELPIKTNVGASCCEQELKGSKESRMPHDMSCVVTEKLECGDVNSNEFRCEKTSGLRKMLLDGSGKLVLPVSCTDLVTSIQDSERKPQPALPLSNHLPAVEQLPIPLNEKLLTHCYNESLVRSKLSTDCNSIFQPTDTDRRAINGATVKSNLSSNKTLSPANVRYIQVSPLSQIECSAVQASWSLSKQRCDSKARKQLCRGDTETKKNSTQKCKIRLTSCSNIAALAECSSMKSSAVSRLSDVTLTQGDFKPTFNSTMVRDPFLLESPKSEENVSIFTDCGSPVNVRTGLEMLPESFPKECGLGTAACVYPNLPTHFKTPGVAQEACLGKISTPCVAAASLAIDSSKLADYNSEAEVTREAGCIRDLSHKLQVGFNQTSTESDPARHSKELSSVILDQKITVSNEIIITKGTSKVDTPQVSCESNKMHSNTVLYPLEGFQETTCQHTSLGVSKCNSDLTCKGQVAYSFPEVENSDHKDQVTREQQIPHYLETTDRSIRVEQCTNQDENISQLRNCIQQSMDCGQSINTGITSYSAANYMQGPLVEADDTADKITCGEGKAVQKLHDSQVATVGKSCTTTALEDNSLQQPTSPQINMHSSITQMKLQENCIQNTKCGEQSDKAKACEPQKPVSSEHEALQRKNKKHFTSIVQGRMDSSVIRAELSAEASCENSLLDVSQLSELDNTLDQCSVPIALQDDISLTSCQITDFSRSQCVAVSLPATPSIPSVQPVHAYSLGTIADQLTPITGTLIAAPTTQDDQCGNRELSPDPEKVVVEDEDWMLAQLITLLKAADATVAEANLVECRLNRMTRDLPSAADIATLESLDYQIELTEKKLSEISKEKEQALRSLESVQKQKVELETAVKSRRTDLINEEKELMKLEARAKELETQYSLTKWLVGFNLERADNSGVSITYMWDSLCLEVTYGKELPHTMNDAMLLPLHEINLIKFTVRKAALSPLMVLAHNMVMKAVDKTLFDTVRTSWELYKVVDYISLLSAHSRWLTEDVDQISNHLMEIEEDRIVIKFINLDVHTMFSVTFPLEPGEYPEKVIVPSYQNLVGKDLEPDVLDVLQSVKPGGRYLRKLVEAVDDFLQYTAKCVSNTGLTVR